MAQCPLRFRQGILDVRGSLHKWHIIMASDIAYVLTYSEAFQYADIPTSILCAIERTQSCSGDSPGIWTVCDHRVYHWKASRSSIGHALSFAGSRSEIQRSEGPCILPPRTWRVPALKWMISGQGNPSKDESAKAHDQSKERKLRKGLCLVLLESNSSCEIAETRIASMRIYVFSTLMEVWVTTDPYHWLYLKRL